ncbi:MAG: glucans biosynthesis glucosyltransferase MdoH [Alphaproteobacteria bacterium]
MGSDLSDDRKETQISEPKARPEGSSPGPMPPEATLAMPVQDLCERPECAACPGPAAPTRIARLLAFGGGALLTAFGANEMVRIIVNEQMTWLQGALVVLFVLTFAWIAFSASSAIAGLLVRAPSLRSMAGDRPLTSLTALIMPVYNESPIATTTALQAMGEALAEAGVGERVEIVILSDSTQPDAWVQETQAFARLRAALLGRMAVWYRRRWKNVGRKSGNVEDFVKRWGGRYDFMVVLDADSLMSAETIIGLIRAMEADERLGLLQTVPNLAGGRSLFARLQQFAGSSYGPVVANSVAAWQGDDGNYWGHNAIIRLIAFAEACGLPVLPGKKPFGGEIMSHDFVEAALLRRAGWAVRMVPERSGSWEDSPPSLLDTAIRDRRWAQGNLQHVSVIGAKGLAWPNRVHFLIGIMSYLASPLWLGLIAIGLLLTLQAQWARPEYFPDILQLFPSWPSFDSERMLRLLVSSMVILFLPRIVGLIGMLLQRDQRRAAGSPLGAAASFVVETLLSALYAPIMMLLQCRQLYDILRGRDSGWATQRRDGGTSWGEAFRVHRWHTAIGLLLAVGAFLVSPILLAWLSPILLGLVLSIPLSRMSGSVAIGRMLLRLRLLRIPEEVDTPEVIARRDALIDAAEPLPEDGLLALVQSKTVRDQHLAALLPRPAEPRGAPNPDRLTAIAKIDQAETRDEALGWLTRPERLQIQGDPELITALAALPHLVSHEGKAAGAG